MAGTRSQSKRGANKGKQREVPEVPNALGAEGVAQAERDEGGPIPPRAREIARHLEIQRDADWRAETGEQARTTWQRRTALVLQRRGDVSQPACDRCQNVVGAFVSCVSAPALGGAAFQRGACANCLWDNRQRSCSLRGKIGLEREGVRQSLDEGEYSLRQAIAKEAAGVQETEEEEYVEEADASEAEGGNDTGSTLRNQPTASSTFFGAFMPGRRFARVGHSQRGPRCFFDGDELRFPISRQIWASPRRLQTARSDLAHFASILDARLFELGHGEGGDDYLFWGHEARRLPRLYRPPRRLNRPLPSVGSSSSSDGDPAPPGGGANTSFEILSTFQTSGGQDNRDGDPGPSQAPARPPLASREEMPDSQPEHYQPECRQETPRRDDGAPGPSQPRRRRNLLNLPDTRRSNHRDEDREPGPSRAPARHPLLDDMQESHSTAPHDEPLPDNCRYTGGVRRPLHTTSMDQTVYHAEEEAPPPPQERNPPPRYPRSRGVPRVAQLRLSSYPDPRTAAQPDTDTEPANDAPAQADSILRDIEHELLIEHARERRHLAGYGTPNEPADGTYPYTGPNAYTQYPAQQHDHQQYDRQQSSPPPYVAPQPVWPVNARGLSPTSSPPESDGAGPGPSTYYGPTDVSGSETEVDAAPPPDPFPANAPPPAFDQGHGPALDATPAADNIPAFAPAPASPQIEQDTPPPRYGDHNQDERMNPADYPQHLERHREYTVQRASEAITELAAAPRRRRREDYDGNGDRIRQVKRARTRSGRGYNQLEGQGGDCGPQ